MEAKQFEQSLVPTLIKGYVFPRVLLPAGPYPAHILTILLIV